MVKPVGARMQPILPILPATAKSTIPSSKGGHSVSGTCPVGLNGRGERIAARRTRPPQSNDQPSAGRRIGRSLTLGGPADIEQHCKRPNSMLDASRSTLKAQESKERARQCAFVYRKMGSPSARTFNHSPQRYNLIILFSDTIFGSGIEYKTLALVPC